MYEEGILIYDEMRKYLSIYKGAVSHNTVYEENFIFFFISVSLFFHDLYFQV
jgi:hypothetical protein